MKAIIHAEQALEEWRAGVRTRRHVAACDGATAICIFEQWIDPGAGAPAHFHPAEEALTVLSGRAEFWLDQHRKTLSKDASLIVPAWVRHGFSNVGATVLHIHAVLALPHFEAHFDGIDVPVRRWEMTSVFPA
ncbi:quercetin dioxygenase-like cupin family protein [Mycoplana sp. BE70]|uniref:cupin domain-containing protein n=1 Tax=Mycoplana sp. BE70 TaxID=2817775 RepID=UPI002855EDAF|nr:cupin domain-containing protein [Mycoplana sp. BE70]MDR6756713.1 quercetin dioxygenase-like cupin family protein [Mycoplana sp. BE70]